MTSNEAVAPGSETDLALNEALRAANLRAGGATSTVSTQEWEPSAAEAGDASGSGGADGE